MSQATVEEDGVSWIDEGGSGPCPDTGLESSNLSPAEVNILRKNVYKNFVAICLGYSGENDIICLKIV